MAIDDFAARCRALGFDIVHPFRLDWFNARADEALRLPDLGRTDALGVLVGNTRALWPAFLEALRNEPGLRRSEHPVDRYAVESITAAATVLDTRHVVLWAHETVPKALAVARLAHAAGLGWLSPSHLSVHPVHGPWIAFRAVLVLDMTGPPGEPPMAPDPCTRCTKPCLEALERAVATSSPLDARTIAANWTTWARVREVCPEGRSSRYGHEQLRYHYTKDRSALKP